MTAGLILDILAVLGFFAMLALSPRFAAKVGTIVGAEIKRQLKPIHEELAELRRLLPHPATPTEVEPELDRTPVLSLAHDRDVRRN